MLYRFVDLCNVGLQSSEHLIDSDTDDRISLGMAQNVLTPPLLFQH